MTTTDFALYFERRSRQWTSRSRKPRAHPTHVSASETARPDAIVLDVRMPGLDGAAFCAQLKGSRATRDIPVVLLTGSDMATEETAAARWAPMPSCSSRSARWSC